MAIQLVSKTGRPLKVIQAKVVRHGRRIVIDGQIYEQIRGYATIEHATVDLKALADEVQIGFDREGVDATVGGIRHIRARNYDYLVCDAWASAASPIVPWIAVIILMVVATACVSVGTYVVSNILWNWTHTRVHCPYCGVEVYDASELKGHIRTVHPEESPYVCPYCGTSFATEAELNQHIKECTLKPPGVPGWLPWLFGLVTVTVVGVYVAPKIIEAARRWR